MSISFEVIIFKCEEVLPQCISAICCLCFEHGHSSNKHCSSLLVKSSHQVGPLAGRVNALATGSCHANSPLTRGMLILRHQLHVGSSTTWNCCRCRCRRLPVRLCHLEKDSQGGGWCEAVQTPHRRMPDSHLIFSSVGCLHVRREAIADATGHLQLTRGLY